MVRSFNIEEQVTIFKLFYCVYQSLSMALNDFSVILNTFYHIAERIKKYHTENFTQLNKQVFLNLNTFSFCLKF